jgi:hypothetical protein
MTHCLNCGHESHCGAPLMKEFRGNKGNGGLMGMVEACKHCRCKLCADISEIEHKSD